MVASMAQQLGVPIAFPSNTGFQGYHQWRHGNLPAAATTMTLHPVQIRPGCSLVRHLVEEASQVDENDMPLDPNAWCGPF